MSKSNFFYILVVFSKFCLVSSFQAFVHFACLQYIHNQLMYLTLFNGFTYLYTHSINDFFKELTRILFLRLPNDNSISCYLVFKELFCLIQLIRYQLSLVSIKKNRRIRQGVSQTVKFFFF